MDLKVSTASPKSGEYTGVKIISTPTPAIHHYQSDQKFEKKHPIFGNVAKTVAKLQKLKLKVKNSCIILLLNVKINCVLKLLI